MLLTMYNALARCHFALARCYLQRASASLRASALSLTRRYAFAYVLIRTPYQGIYHFINIVLSKFKSFWWHSINVLSVSRRMKLRVILPFGISKKQDLHKQYAVMNVLGSMRNWVNVPSINLAKFFREKSLKKIDLCINNHSSSHNIFLCRLEVCHSSAYRTISVRSVYIKIISYSGSIYISKFE